MRKLFLFLSMILLLAAAPSPGTLPASVPGFPLYGEASWYSSESCRREGTSGVWTASGEPYFENDLTCALRRRDFGHFYRVTNLDNGKFVVVKHNDFGPSRGWYDRRRGVYHNLSGRVIDLSKGAFQKLADTRHGVIRRVKVERL